MKVATLEAAKKDYGKEWLPDNDIDRERLLAHLPYNVLVEGGDLENDSLREWIAEEIGSESEGGWDCLWYENVAYDYGYWEYFFSNERNLQIFIQKIPTVYGLFPSGRWLRSDGYDSLIERPIES